MKHISPQASWASAHLENSCAVGDGIAWISFHMQSHWTPDSTPTCNWMYHVHSACMWCTCWNLVILAPLTQHSTPGSEGFMVAWRNQSLYITQTCSYILSVTTEQLFNELPFSQGMLILFTTGWNIIKYRKCLVTRSNTICFKKVYLLLLENQNTCFPRSTQKRRGGKNLKIGKE